ncbi:DUF255 domain-containing protein [uncultured Polaribacter sp.]|uniref:thioredoxin family protein n=1 Tax=uncultured Polaribacter sp. TaxID=174711 RepID=UPI002626EFF5|nr:DUF255 domain-containing protein [uncultured Polaribacter sp.]
MKKLICLIFILGYFTTHSQKIEALKIYSFSEVEKLHQQKPKPIVAFIYTDWCKICYGMKNTTFKNNGVVKLLNDNFYFVKLNGEEQKDILFLGKKFVYKPSGNKTGTHQLAKELATLKGKISYPTTTILNTNFEIIFQKDSYINSKEMIYVLNQILE